MDLHNNNNLLKQALQEATSAIKAEQIGEKLEIFKHYSNEQERANKKKDAILIQGAQANIAQNELLEEQLKAVKEQNKQLNEQCSLMKELYETEKKQAEDNAKVAQKSEQDAKHSKIFGWVSFVV